MTAKEIAQTFALPLLSVDTGKEALDDFLKLLEEQDPQKAESLKQEQQKLSFLRTVFFDAPFVRDCALGNPVLAARFLMHPDQDHLGSLVDQVRDGFGPDITENELMCHLRLLKRDVALLTALSDLSRTMTVDQVTSALSDFADAALLSAVRFSLRQEEKRGKISLLEDGEPEKLSGLIVLAMGKHGAGELNYSSDIDLIVFYDPTRVKCKDRYEIQPAMVRVVRRIVKIIQERTENGYVFRTDLRLRPDPGATAVAISTDAALNYYESIGQNWERAAYIKARPVACDLEAASAFLTDLSPFVWRKYMDFAMIADVQAMKRHMHLHKGHATIALSGHNVKLGRGGIREIEFFAQTQQLIAGGRNVDLRVRQTVQALGLLAQANWVEPVIADELAGHYRFLRNVEHRIQMRHDEQTHLLPDDDEAFCCVARLSGFADREAFETALLTCFKAVSRHYAQLFEGAGHSTAAVGPLYFPVEHDDPETLLNLAEMGFENVAQVSAVIRHWQSGLYKAMRSKRAREALVGLIPRLLASLSRSGRPDVALFAFDDFLKNLPAGIQLFSLLEANSGLLDLIGQLMGSAPRLSETISRRPHVFDALLEPAFFGKVPTRDNFDEQLKLTLNEAKDYQDILDRTRIFTQEQQFLVGTRLLSGTITIRESQRLYSDLAETAIASLFSTVQHEVTRQHGVVDGADIAVVALGKLGGREMSPKSDLDMIVIYETTPGVTQSDGPRPLHVSQYFARLTQRLIAALSAPTGEGVAYEVDMRLRPSGKAGPLATDLDAFATYQHEKAWAWEHMALTRARVIVGNTALTRKIESITRDVVALKRDRAALRRDISDMNERLHEAKEAGDIFAVKEARGGLVDVEFITQFHQLATAHDARDSVSVNTADALVKINPAQGILKQEEIGILADACDFYTGLIQLLRLCVEGQVRQEGLPDDLVIRLCSFAEVPDIIRLELKINEMKQEVLSIYNRVIMTI